MSPFWARVNDLCSFSPAPLPLSSARLLTSACGLHPCVIDGIPLDADMHTHRRTRCPLNRPITHTQRPRWLMLADPQLPIKRARRLTGCAAAQIYWVGSLISSLPSQLNYFSFRWLFLLSCFHTVPILFSFINFILLLILFFFLKKKVRRGCSHLPSPDV